jgi:hypothetical protein
MYGLNNDKMCPCPKIFLNDDKAFRAFWDGRWTAELIEDRLKGGIPLDDMPFGFQQVQVDETGQDISEVFVARLRGI